MLFCHRLCHLEPPGKPSKDSGGGYEQTFVRAVISLHDKYLGYVADCFANSR